MLSPAARIAPSNCATDAINDKRTQLRNGSLSSQDPGVGGTLVAKAGIEYAEAPGVATITQVATHGDLQGLGLGTALIATAEERIRRRGLTVARIGVEDDNPRARALYERLGYQEVGRRAVSWEAEAADGSLLTYHTVVAEMDKTLTS